MNVRTVIEQVPTAGGLILPNRLCLHTLKYLLKALDNRKIVWICHYDDKDAIAEDVLQFVEKTKFATEGIDAEFITEFAKQAQQEVVEQETIYIYLPVENSCTNSLAWNTSGEYLQLLTQINIPIYACYSNKSDQECYLALSAEPITGEHAMASWQQKMFELSYDYFNTLPILQDSIAYRLFKGLKQAVKGACLADGVDEDNKISYDKVLAAAIALANKLKKQTKERHVGIILPAGKAGFIANLAVIFANKVPVNFNYSVPDEIFQSLLSRVKIDLFLSATPFYDKFKNKLSWPPSDNLLFLDKVMVTLYNKIRTWFFLVKILPTNCLIKWLRISKKGGDREAVLLFTSGSSQEPKGVSLTHRNIMANVQQFSNRLESAPLGISFLSSLPLFHSFGVTATFLYPCMKGISVAVHPNPLAADELAKLIHRYQISILPTTPTFLRFFLKRAKPEQLSSLKLCITGAEKLPEKIADQFEKKFGIRPQEGYGLTETSPVLSFNIDHDKLCHFQQFKVHPLSKAGSVGRVLQGIQVRIVSTEDDNKILPLSHTGIIQVRGANVFSGYLDNDEATSQAFSKDGWFHTGDIGKIDQDGFLFIEGRSSRFSKIGGEMVSHTMVENILEQLFAIDSEEKVFAIVGVKDDKKGEALYLLSTQIMNSLEQDLLDIRYKMKNAGYQNMWCPQGIVATSKIPILPSGKLDIKACEQQVYDYLNK